MTTARRGSACEDGHAFTVRFVRGHEEWYCAACYHIPSVRDLLATYVERHGGRIVP